VDPRGFLFYLLLQDSLPECILLFIYPLFKPVRILKSKFSNSLAAVSVRKGLVVFQFVISAILIISSTVISKQMQYMRSKDLGFTKDQEMIIPLRTETAKATYQSLKTELNKMPGVASVGASTYYPGIFNPSDRGLYKEARQLITRKT
jgi:putative ABC transport system permease protein